MTSSTKEKGCIDCFDGKELFTTLTPSETEQLDNHQVELKFKKGEVICKQGSFASNIIYLKSGLVKIYLEFNDKNLILRVEPTDKLLGVQSLCGNIYRYTCVAYEESTVCMIDSSFFKELINSNGQFAAQVIKSISETAIACFDRMVCLTQKKSHGRFADILLCLSQRIYKSDKFRLHFPRKDLAELSNMSVENLTRVIQDFKSDNIILLTGNNVEILNMEMLKKISENG